VPFLRGKPKRRRCGGVKVVANRAISAISRRPASRAKAIITNTGAVRYWVLAARGSGAWRKTFFNELTSGAFKGS